jgi:hypothetical protein
VSKVIVLAEGRDHWAFVNTVMKVELCKHIKFHDQLNNNSSEQGYDDIQENYILRLILICKFEISTQKLSVMSQFCVNIEPKQFVLYFSCFSIVLI